MTTITEKDPAEILAAIRRSRGPKHRRDRVMEQFTAQCKFMFDDLDFTDSEGHFNEDWLDMLDPVLLPTWALRLRHAAGDMVRLADALDRRSTEASHVED